jgi:hypothetical protein
MATAANAAVRVLEHSERSELGQRPGSAGSGPVTRALRATSTDGLTRGPAP